MISCMINIPQGEIYYQDENGNQVGERLFTYDEDERQQNLENAHNAQVLWRPEFIPFYLKEVEKYDLSFLEGLLYGLIRFYLTNNSVFFWNNKTIGEVLHRHPVKISEAIRSLQNKGLIKSTYRHGRSRKIELNYNIKPQPVNPYRKRLGVLPKTVRGITENGKHIENNYRDKEKEKTIKEKDAGYPSLTVQDEPAHTHFPEDTGERLRESSPQRVEGEGSAEPTLHREKTSSLPLPSPKKPFGEFVRLTEEEHRKLSQTMGGELEERIEALNCYIGSKGKRYKSHYYTLLSWYRRDIASRDDQFYIREIRRIGLAKFEKKYGTKLFHKFIDFYTP